MGSAAGAPVPPRHIAVIMDGNGRWARKRGLPRAAGHAAGAETFRRIANYCKNIGVPYLTAFAFSTENWKRPAGEIERIFALLEKYLDEAVETMERDGVRIRFIGDTSVFSGKLRALIGRVEEIGRRYDGPLVNICLNYGSRAEILRAAQLAVRELGEGEALTEEAFGKHLFTSGIPDPDLVIRPSGEMRMSNFLLWQSAYAEFYFTDKLWPDFTPADIDAAIAEYSRRSRRFGNIT